MGKIKWVLASIIVLLTNGVFAQNIVQSRIILDIPILDLPYQNLAAQTTANHRVGIGANSTTTKLFTDYISAFGNPSMNQSLNWGASFLTLYGYGVKSSSNILVKPNTRFKRIVNRVIGEVLFTGGNSVLIYFPLGDGWVHEEFHRSVMTLSQVSSFDNINSFNSLGQGHISVTREKDTDLAYFKKNDPAGFNRMLVAGGEGEILLTRKLYLNNFYYHSKLPITIYSALIKALVSNYPYSDSDTTGLAELNTRKLNEPNVAQRDFTGPDYSGWAWHIFKPNIPYDSLGQHPTGNGIDRYKSAADLTSEELSFLHKVGKTMFWNFLSPMTLGINRIRFGNGKFINFSTQVFINGFGYDFNPEIYLKMPNSNLYIGVHNYHNYVKSYWGIEGGMYRNKIRILNKEMQYDAKAIIWGQPQNQEFKTSKTNAGGLIQLKLYYPVNSWLQSYIDAEAKTKGWVAGNPYLKANLSVRIGVSMILKRKEKI